MAYKVSGSIQQPMTLTVLNSDGIAQATQAFSTGAWEIDKLVCPSGTIVGFTEDDTFKGFGNVPFVEYDSRPSVPWTETFLPEVDRTRWLDGVTGYYPYIYNGKLRMQADSTRTRTTVISKYFISGDFDVEISFNIIYGPATDGWHIYFRPYFPCASTNVNWNDDTSVQVRRSYISTGHKYYFEGYNGVAFSNVVSVSDTSGKLRLVRSGSVITGYYWGGSSWTSIASQDYGTNLSGYPVYFLIGHETAVNNPTLIVDYTNFKVNSGTIQYRFDERFNYARSNTVYSNYHTPNMDVYKAISSVPLIPYVYYNKLRFELDYTQQAKGLELKEKLIGNFDVQVDLDIMSGPAGDNWQFKMFAHYDANNSIRIGRIYVAGNTHCIRTETTVGGVVNSYYVGFTSISLTMRIKRIGTTVYTYYKDRTAGTWTLHRTINSFPTGDIALRLYGSIAEIMAYNHAIADFDNLIINCVSSINTKLLVDVPSVASTIIPEPNTALLLHFDESTPIDSSYNKFPITISGSMSSAVTPKIGTNSLSFNGTSQSIRIERNFQFGTGPFTIDTWFYCTSTSAYQPVIFLHGPGTYGTVIIYNRRTDRSDRMTIQYWNGTAWVYSDTTLTPAQNTWYHITVVRNGTALTLYVDGVNRASATISAGLNFDSDVFQVGYEGTNYYKGYLDEVRLSKGIARWTSNFTPSTSAYAADSYTELLLHGDEFPIIDSSSTPKTLTNNGGVNLLSKFNGSVLFDGTDDKIVFPLLQDLNFGTGNFTIDFWMRSVNHSTGAPGIFSTQINGVNQWWQNSTSNFVIHFASTEQLNTLYLSHTNIANYQVPITGISTNTWYHIAYVRNGNILKSYKDGVLNSSLDITGKSFGTSTLNAGLGSQCSYAYYNGYLDEFRISKGIARWLSYFTPPTVSYTPDSYTKLLLHFDEAPLVDSGLGKSLTLNGGVARNATQSKFGSYSGYFDGNGDYISISHSSDFEFGTDNFTIDFWCYTTVDVSTSQFIMVKRSVSGPTGEFIALMHNKIWLTSNGSSWDIANGVSFSGVVQNQWGHIAVIRNGSKFYVAVNGNIQVVATSTASVYSSSQPLIIGGDTNTLWFTGYIDEFRISKGIARYSSDFTPPTSAYSA